jgi:hypothetical protein
MRKYRDKSAEEAESRAADMDNTMLADVEPVDDEKKVEMYV